MMLSLNFLATSEHEEKIFENVWVISYSSLKGEGVNITIEGPVRWVPIIGILIYIKKLRFEYHGEGNTVIWNMKGERVFNVTEKHSIIMENVSIGFFRMIFPLYPPIFIPIIITHAEKVIIRY